MENPYAAPSADVAVADPYAAPSDFVLAEPATRLGAKFIDGLAYGVIAGLVAGLALATDSYEPGEGASATVIGAGVVLGLGALVVQTWLLATRGQTLGKIALGIRVVRRDGSAPGFVHAVLLRSWLFGILGQIPLVGALIGLVDILLIFRQTRLCLHDDVAGTMVVQGQPA